MLKCFARRCEGGFAPLSVATRLDWLDWIQPRFRDLCAKLSSAYLTLLYFTLPYVLTNVLILTQLV